MAFREWLVQKTYKQYGTGTVAGHFIIKCNICQGLILKQQAQMHIEGEHEDIVSIEDLKEMFIHQGLYDFYLPKKMNYGYCFSK